MTTPVTPGGGGGGGSASVRSAPTFYEREREKLVAEIAEVRAQRIIRAPFYFINNETEAASKKGLEVILGNANALNRKLEESISVGHEFAPIAHLWGQFADLMSAAGIDPAKEQQGSAAGTATMASSTMHADGNQEAEERRDDEGPLPRGVAPGGGIVYGRDA